MPEASGHVGSISTGKHQPATFNDVGNRASRSDNTAKSAIPFWASVSLNDPARPRMTSQAKGSPAIHCQSGIISAEGSSVPEMTASPSTTLHCTSNSRGAQPIPAARDIDGLIVDLPDDAANHPILRSAREEPHSSQHGKEQEVT